MIYFEMSYLSRVPLNDDNPFAVRARVADIYKSGEDLDFYLTKPDLYLIHIIERIPCKYGSIHISHYHVR